MHFYLFIFHFFIFRLIYFSIYSLIRRHLAHKLGIQVPSSRRRTRYIQITLYRQRSQQQQQQQQQEQHIINQLEQNPLVENNNATLNNNSQEASHGRSASTFDTQDADVLYGRTDRDLNVTIMGALLWPTISSFVGK